MLKTIGVNATVNWVSGILFLYKTAQLMEAVMDTDSTPMIKEDARSIQSYLWKTMVESKNSNT